MDLSRLSIYIYLLIAIFSVNQVQYAFQCGALKIRNKYININRLYLLLRCDLFQFSFFINPPRMKNILDGYFSQANICFALERQYRYSSIPHNTCNQNKPQPITSDFKVRIFIVSYKLYIFCCHHTVITDLENVPTFSKRTLHAQRAP